MGGEDVFAQEVSMPGHSREHAKLRLDKVLALILKFVCLTRVS